MNTDWKIKFVNAKAEEELLSLSADLKAKFLHVTEMIVAFGPHHVGLPHVSPLENKLWELRLKGKDNIARSIYILASERRLVILRTFIKKTQKTPTSELKIAYMRLKEMKND
ncbi:MAG: Phage-related protein [Alphaproteobacteria bacterium]|jgi:phage-related protein|nr:Phage-related protein [Alphaproteobacteria bacterium]